MTTQTISKQDIKLFQEVETMIKSRASDPELIEKKIFDFISKRAAQINYLHYYYAASYLSDINKFDSAELFFKKCVELEPNFPDVYYTVAMIHFKAKRYALAFEQISKAYKLNYRNEVIHGIIGTCLAFKFPPFPAKATEFFREQKKLYPETFLKFKHAYSLALRNIGEAEQATIEALDVISADKEHYKGLYTDLIMTLMHSKVFSDETLFKIALTYNKNVFPESIHKFKHDRRLDKKTPRVGMMFPYTKHSIAHWLLELFKNRDKEFYYVAYHNSEKFDEDTENIKNNVDLFRNIYAMSAEEAAQLIYDDEIDVLFDFRTNVFGDRTDVIKLKPAPVQVNWLDSIPPTGCPEMDYTITDNYIIPVESEKYFTEKIYRLPSSYFYYKEPDYDIEIKEPPFLKNGYITFASFHRSSKVNTDLLKTWAKILKEVNGSKLLIKNSLMLEGAYQKRLLDVFEQEGLETERIILENQETMVPFLEKCNEIDICLDSLPLNGASTNLRTFWMGKPIVIILGEKRFSRISYSILKNLGLEELIANSEEEYIKLAVELANSPDRIIEYSKTLRKKLVESDMCNAPKFQRQLQDAIMFMWEEFKKNFEPNS